MKRPAHILPLIILSQFAGTSLWFAGNAILPELRQQLHLQNDGLGNITSIVQFGFIIGTFIFAILSVADRVSSAAVFFFSALIAGAANLCIIWLAKDIASLMLLRFITGFFLAGIYPVGMKIAADWYESGLGKTLGYLVGALVLGTAFPYLLKSNIYALPARDVIIFTSAFAFAGGLLILLFVGNGPYQRPASRFRPSIIINVFRSRDFRAAAFGYFGHMWELYTYWAFAPLIFSMYVAHHHPITNLPMWVFAIIAVGGLGCIVGGFLSQKWGSTRVAFYALCISGICSILSFTLFSLPVWAFASIVIIWGFTATADSPQFSTLVATIAIPEYKGTALTVVTCIGFAITIVSIQFINFILDHTTHSEFVFMLLAPGPILGLLAMRKLLR